LEPVKVRLTADASLEAIRGTGYNYPTSGFRTPEG
jgi:hypothetical protein